MKKISLFLIIPFVVAGCLQIKTEPDISGGVYRSRDKGQTFESVSKISTIGAPRDFSQDNAKFIQIDPTDSNTLYYSSVENGLFVSNNGGDSWKNILRDKGVIYKVIVDVNEPCHIYAQTRQNIFKSIDCGRRWSNVYLEKVAKRSISDIVLDVESPNRLLMGLSDGSVLVSDDYALSWRVLHVFGVGVKNLYINPKNTQILYATTARDILRSNNQGLDWDNLNDVIVKDFEFKKGNIVSDLVFLPEFDDAFYTVSEYGILKSVDSGQSWEALPLLPQPKKEKILSIAVNPNDMNELYYGTAKALYYSQDGGVNWQTLKSPGSRYNQALMIHPVNPAIVYVGAYSPPK